MKTTTCDYCNKLINADQVHNEVSIAIVANEINDLIKETKDFHDGCLGMWLLDFNRIKLRE